MKYFLHPIQEKQEALVKLKKKIIRQFYLDDDYTRIMPDRKDSWRNQ